MFYSEIISEELFNLILNNNLTVHIVHCKNSFEISSNYLSLQRSLGTVRNNADSVCGVKTKIQI